MQVMRIRNTATVIIKIEKMTVTFIMKKSDSGCPFIIISDEYANVHCIFVKSFESSPIPVRHWISDGKVPFRNSSSLNVQDSP
jgi:hypothetical protein